MSDERVGSVSVSGNFVTLDAVISLFLYGTFNAARVLSVQCELVSKIRGSAGLRQRSALSKESRILYSRLF